jgi:hypothetical protein
MAFPNRCSRCKRPLPVSRHVCNRCIRYAVKAVAAMTPAEKRQALKNGIEQTGTKRVRKTTKKKEKEEQQEIKILGWMND